MAFHVEGNGCLCVTMSQITKRQRASLRVMNIHCIWTSFDLFLQRLCRCPSGCRLDVECRTCKLARVHDTGSILAKAGRNANKTTFIEIMNHSRQDGVRWSWLSPKFFSTFSIMKIFARFSTSTMGFSRHLSTFEH